MGKCKRQTETEDGIEDGMVAGFGEADAIRFVCVFVL